MNINLNNPKNPILSTILANTTLISVFTSTCNSGSQICNGHIGYLIPNIVYKVNHMYMIMYILSKKHISKKI